MKEQECSNEYVDTTNRKRLYFYAELSKMLVMFDSSYDEVNDLIYKLYTLSNSLSDIEPRRKNIEYEHDTKEDKQVDENTFIRENDTHDLRIYTIIATIQEESTWAIRDTLYDITDKIYHKLDKIIHPDYRPGLDYERVRYYTEVEYISKEEQKRIKAEHNLDFKEEDWRA